MTEPTAAAPPAYVRPTISASRLKAIGGEKGEPGCERKLAAAYLFGLKQSGSDATEFGTAVHAIGEHHQLTGEILDPEGEPARVYTAGAHIVTACGPLLVEHEHIGELPDATPYVAYIDGHSGRVGPTGVLVIQDLKTTSNAQYALQGDDGEALTEATARGPYALSEDIQGIFYAWILLAAPPHWFAPCLPDGVSGPRHWQWWDPAERGVTERTRGRLRWVYFLTRGVPRAWEVNDWTTPAMAAAALDARIMPLVAKINALHEWHHGRVTGTIPGGPPLLDEIDRTLDACRDRRRGTYGRWCGAGEHDACNFDQIGTPVLDLVQLRVRKTMTPQERLAEIRNRKGATNAGGMPGLVAAASAATPAPETPAASPPAQPASAPTAAAAAAATSTAPTPAPAITLAEPSAASAELSASSAPATAVTTVAVPEGELTRGQKAAATRAAKKAAGGASAAPPAAPPIAGNINPPEALEALAKLADSPIGLAKSPVEADANALGIDVRNAADETARANFVVDAAGKIVGQKLTAPRPEVAASVVEVPVAVVTLVGIEAIVEFLIAKGYTVSEEQP